YPRFCFTRPGVRIERITPKCTAGGDKGMNMKTDDLVAIDVHVHLETEIEDNAANEAAQKYFGNSGVGRNRHELAEYYRSRKIGCVVFTVDERLTGRPPIPNDEIAAFAAENADIMFAFASVDPLRGQAAVAEAKRLITAGGS